MVDNSSIEGISPNATVDELREALAKRVAYLRDTGAIDLEALPAPASVTGGTRSEPPVTREAEPNEPEEQD